MYATRCSSIKTVLLLVCAAALCAGGETLTVVLRAGDYAITTNGASQAVFAPSFGRRNVPGEPALPERVCLIAVPPDAKVAGVRLEAAAPASLGMGFRIGPAAVELPARPGAQTEAAQALREFEANYARAYGGSEVYPPEVARYLGAGGLRKYQVVRVAYAPWQYCGKTGELLLSSQLTVHVDYAVTSKQGASAAPPDAVAEPEAQLLISNYEQAQAWYGSGGTVALGSLDYPYIVLCTEATRSAVQPLVDWKNSIGLRTFVFTKEWLATNAAYAAHSMERKIRYYLRDHYLAWHAQYLLIVGDTDSIPMRRCTAGVGGSPDAWEADTDSYYGELSLLDAASWDLDGDGYFGERLQDSVDWLMELHVGRVPFNDPAAVRQYCERVSAYERDTGAWKSQRALFLGAIWNYENELLPGIPKTDSAYLVNAMTNDFFHFPVAHTMFEKEGIDPSPFGCTWQLLKQNVFARWTTNYFSTGPYAVVNLSGHGTEFGLHQTIWLQDDNHNGVPEYPPDVNPSEVEHPLCFDQEVADQLDAAHPAIVFFGACGCGEAEIPGAIAKRVLRGGAIAAVASAGNTQYTAGWEGPQDGSVSTLQYMFNDHLVRLAERPGAALSSAKHDFYLGYLARDGSQQLLLNMTYFGDPSLVRTGIAELANFNGDVRAGWADVVVARGAADGTGSWCPVSATLPGNSAQTYLNFAVQNDGGSTTYACYHRLYVDGAYWFGASWAWMDAGARLCCNNAGPFTVRGGRHTVKVVYDPLGEASESNEMDNQWSAQYVWEPLLLADQTPLTRSAPPPPGDGPYANCDGFKTTMGGSQFWTAVGILPLSSGDDFDIRYYEGYSGSTSGFDSYPMSSSSAAGLSDFVIVNRNVALTSEHYWGAVNVSGSGSYRIQQANSASYLSGPGSGGPFEIGANDVVDMHEVFLNAGTWRVALANVSGSANLGLSLYNPNLAYFGKNDSLASSNTGGPGAGESLTITVAEAGFFGVAVWKTGSGDDGCANTYTLHFDNFISPSPSPMTWEAEPHACGTGEVVMVASPATDSSGVEYYFRELSGSTGGADSGWQESRVYTNSGLRSGLQYLYQVKARDKSINHNETEWSNVGTALTHVATSCGVPAYSTWVPRTYAFQVVPAHWSCVALSPGPVDHDLRATDEPELFAFYMDSRAPEEAVDLVAVNGALWAGGEHYAQVFSGTGSFYAVEAEWCASQLDAGVARPASMPGNSVLDLYEAELTSGRAYRLTLDITAGAADLAVYLFAPSRSAGNVYECDGHADAQGGGGDESLDVAAADTGLYGVAVVNKNGGSVSYVLTLETADVDAPSPDPLTWARRPYAIGTNAVVMVAATASDASGVEYYFRELTGNAGGCDSGWQGSPVYTNGGLATGGEYRYAVRARDRSAAQNATAWSPEASALTHALLHDNEPVIGSWVPRGYAFNTFAGEWSAVGIGPVDDHDLLLDDAPDLESPHAWSIHVGPTREFCVCNGAVWGDSVQYAGVGYGTNSAHAIEAQSSGPGMSLGGVVSCSMLAHEVLQVYQLPIASPVRCRLALEPGPGAGGLSLWLFRPTRGSGGRADADWSSSTEGSEGAAVSFDADVAGNYGIVVINEGGVDSSYRLMASASLPFSISRLGRSASDGVVLEWDSQPGRNYEVRFGAAPDSASLTGSVGFVTAAGSRCAVTNASSAASQLFFRVYDRTP